MAYSYQEYIADGTTTTFNISFPYIKEADVALFVDGVNTPFTFTTPQTVSLTTAPASGALIRLERTTDITNRLVDFSSGSLLTEEDLDNSNIQVFYASQEAIDTATDAISKDTDGKMDGQNRILKNVQDPENPQDAVTKNYLENEWLTLSDKAQLNALDIPKLNRVHESVANVDTTADNIADVNRVAQSANNIDRVNTSITKVDRVYDSIDELDRVHTSIDNIDRLEDSADKLDRVYTSVNNLDRVHTSIDNVDRVHQSIDEIDRVNTSIAKVDRVYTSISAVDTVAADLNEPTSEIETVANSITNVNNVGSNIQNVLDVDANESNINAAVSNESNINAAVSNATNITKVANNETNITAVADNETNINQVATDTVAVTNVSTNIGAVNNVSTNMSDVTNVSDNMTAIQAASTNIEDVQTVAQEVQKVIDVANDLNEATSEIDVVAGSIDNVDAVGEAITAVTTVANNIDNLQDFFDTYFVSATAPETPTEGDLWYDTSADILKVYNGGSWQNAGSSVNGTSASQAFIATADQETFTITAGYDSGYVNVFLNGVLQVEGTDYTATDGATVVFAEPLTEGDEVFVLAFGTFTLADHYSKTASDARYMPIDAVTLPDQTGHAGQYLTTDGTNADWADVPPAVTSDIHVFYMDANGDLIWEHGAEVTDLQDANGNDLYDLVIVGSSDQTYAVNQTTGNLQVTIG
jgi:hypothetical protein